LYYTVSCTLTAASAREECEYSTLGTLHEVLELGAAV
jgi:hypothetical protein